MVTALFLILKVCFGLNEILKEIPSNLCIFKSEWRFGKSLVTLFKEIHTCPYNPPSHLLTGERGKGIWSEEGTLKELIPALLYSCLTDEQHWVIIQHNLCLLLEIRGPSTGSLWDECHSSQIFLILYTEKWKNVDLLGNNLCF